MEAFENMEKRGGDFDRQEVVRTCLSTYPWPEKSVRKAGSA